MNKTINSAPILEQPVSIETPPSAGTMLVTILLMIVSLLMTSTMMMHHTFEKNSTDTGNKNPSLAWFSFLTNNHQGIETAKTAVFSKLFGNGSDKVRWPKLTLTGFGSGTDQESSFAFINGKKVHLGQRINGKVKLVEIRAHDVVVEYKAEQKTLTVSAAANN